MGLFTQLEKFDQKLTRGYARWGRWVWRTLIVVPVLVVLWNIYSAAIFLIPICISFDTAEKRRYATYLILNRRFSFEF